MVAEEKIPIVREQIASRLTEEFERRDISLLEIAERSGLSETVVQNYVKGTQPPNFTELAAICSAASLNLFRLISKRYPGVLLNFRNVDNKAREVASEIENAFLIIREILPRPDPPQGLNLNVDDLHARTPVLSAANNVAERFRNKYGSKPLEAFDRVGIPVFVTDAEQTAFDGCFLSSHPFYAIAVNRKTSPGRVLFSLLHELAHFLFDRTRSMRPDTLPTNLFADVFDDDSRPEFIATKFAQFVLIPFAEADRLCRNWDRWRETIDWDLAQSLLDRSGANVDVLVNAMYDILSIRERGIPYKALRDFVTKHLKTPMNSAVLDFLDNRRQELSELLAEESSLFSQEVLKDVRGVFNL